MGPEPKPDADVDSIGIRELRQHASRHIDRVKAGESLAVTERGHLVAYLVPGGKRGAGESILDRLEAAGQLRRATGSIADLLAIEPVPVTGRPLSEVLAEMRDEERW
jgi:prevent-host-death family protein